MKSMLTQAAQMDVFRLSAGFNASRAIEVWASTKFHAKWKQEVLPFFAGSGDQQQLHDFFSSAVVLLGRASSERSVACFYNPWLDGLLLLSVGPGKGRALLEDFCLVSGESWRGESVTTGEDVLALYALKQPLTVTLAHKYAKTIDTFNRLYPPDGPFEFLPDVVKNKVTRTSKEIEPIKGRMLYRANMFKTLFEKRSSSDINIARDLRQMLKDGNEVMLAAYLSPKQDRQMLHTLCQIPPLMRDNLAPNYYVRNPLAGGAIMAMLNSKTPRWLFVIQILGQGHDQKPSVSIEAMDLEASGGIVAKLKGLK
ncbi:MAG: hypothetical protein WCL11_00525 [Verrucomicrobiota bacterium]